MRRNALIATIVIFLVAGTTWALWPATKWSNAFCTPLHRVVGADAKAVALNFGRPEPTLTTAQHAMVIALLRDIRLSTASAPTSQLRTELNRYRGELGVARSTTLVTDAMSHFDEQARTQLTACGINPVGT